MKVPETKRMHVKGSLPNRVSAKDVILHIIGDQGADGADYQCVEFVGKTIDQFSIPSRMVLSNMSVEMGAKAGVCFPDKTTEQWLSQRTDKRWEPVLSDDDAVVEDVSTISKTSRRRSPGRTRSTMWCR
jgi:3-isopropylmalate/(R)-2-methylmalate dehydratase large subunit